MKTMSLRCTSALAALVMLATLSYAQSAEVGKDSFPDIIKFLMDKEQIRFITKVQWFEGEKTKMDTKLVDEAYTSSGRTGQMVVHDAIPTGKLSDLIMSLVSEEKKDTMCPATVEVSPLEEGLILPEVGNLRELLQFTSHRIGTSTPIKLFGLGAILANTIEIHPNSLVKLEPKVDKKNEIIYKLDTGRGFEIRFGFMKKLMEQELSMSNILELDVMIFSKHGKNVVDKVKMGPMMVAQLTLLQIQDQIKDKLSTIPEVFTCNRCTHCADWKNVRSCSGRQTDFGAEI